MTHVVISLRGQLNLQRQALRHDTPPKCGRIETMNDVKDVKYMPNSTTLLKHGREGNIGKSVYGHLKEIV
jgi:hypothetical protein